MKTLTGKVAVVTGGSKGIGAGIALGLGAAGASVVVNYASSAAAAGQVVEQIGRLGSKAVAIQADMSKPEEIRRLFAETKREFGRIDILVNNAGVYNFAPIETITEDAFRRDVDLNVLGPLVAIQEALRLLPAEGGSIINISSIVSPNPRANMLVYSATKAAVDAMTRVLAQELGGRKIRVNSILPGSTDTPGNAAGMEGEAGQAMASATPLGRFGRAEDIANLAVFLAAPESAWITGETIRASGGLQ
ncbi:MAG: glucose 1-dehydrogenase [Bryobacteraceae bacterium]